MAVMELDLHFSPYTKLNIVKGLHLRFEIVKLLGENVGETL